MEIALSESEFEHGNWDGKYSGLLQVDFFQKGRDGVNLRLAGIKIPYYHGDDAEIDKIYRDVQEGQIQMIVEKAVELARDQGSQK